MNARSLVAIAAAALALGACSFQNKYEREAQKITEAVVANDMAPIAGDIAPGVKITRVQVAQWSDELNDQGKLTSIKETTENCPAGAHCFDAAFAKRTYVEMLRMDDNGKVVDWRFHMAASGAGN